MSILRGNPSFPFDELQNKGARYRRAARIARRETGALMQKTMDAICQLALGLTAAFGFSSQVLAVDYYAGKTIEVIVGGAPSGGIDLYARGVARHFGNHIPGSPTFVVKNMPGASGVRAMQQVYSVMPNNGLTIAAITPGAIVAPLIDEKADRSVDPAKLIYLGTTNAGVGICATMDLLRRRSRTPWYARQLWALRALALFPMTSPIWSKM